MLGKLRKRIGILILIPITAVGQMTLPRPQNMLSLFQQAVRHDASYLKTLSGIKASSYDRAIAEAALLPQISAGLSFNYSHQQPITTESSGLSLSLTQNLFNYQTWGTYLSHQYDIQQAQLKTLTAWQDLAQRFLNAYLAVTKAKETLQANETTQRQDRRLVKLARWSYQAGQKTRTDILAARTTYNSAKETVANARLALSQAQSALLAITQQKLTSIPRLKITDWKAPIPTKTTPWERQALQHNPAVLAAHNASLIAQQNVKTKQWQRIPSVSLTGGYNRNLYQHGIGAETETMPSSTKTGSFTANVALKLPLYSGGSINATLQQTIALYREALNNELLIRNTTTDSVRKTLKALLSDFSLMISQKKNVRLDQQALNSIIIAYKGGLKTINDIILQQQSVATERLNLINTRYDAVNQSILLHQALGTLGEEDIIRISQWLKTAHKRS